MTASSVQLCARALDYTSLTPRAPVSSLSPAPPSTPAVPPTLAAPPFDASTADVGIKSPSPHPSPNRVEATVDNSIAAAERSQRRGAPELNTNRLAADPEHRYHQQSQSPNSNLEADPKGYVPHSPMRMGGLRFPSPGHELPPTQTQRPFCGSAEMPAIATAGFEDGAGQQREAWGAWTEPVSRCGSATAGTGTGQSFVERMTSAVRGACQIPWLVLDLSLYSEEKRHSRLAR